MPKNMNPRRPDSSRMRQPKAPDKARPYIGMRVTLGDGRMGTVADILPDGWLQIRLDGGGSVRARLRGAPAPKAPKPKGKPKVGARAPAPLRIVSALDDIPPAAHQEIPPILSALDE